MNLNKTTRSTAIGFILMAALLKCIVFFQNRSLFLDEANLSRNIVEKSYLELFSSLDYEQFAPPLYLWIVKFYTQLFGVHEFSLRLFPILLGLGSLFLMYKILIRLFDDWSILYPIILFGFSLFMLRYHTENKQYAADVFFTLLFIYLAFKYKFSNNKSLISLGVIGAISIWFSMPLAFILAGVGCAIFYKQFIHSKDQTVSYLSYGFMIILWLISFGLFFFFNLKQSIDSKYLQDFHETAYLEFPTSVIAIKQSYAVLRDLLSSMVGPLLLVRIWAAICMLLGIFSLIKKDIGKAILMVIPIASCFFASMLHYYILIPRLSLFLMPILFILLGLGAAVFYKKIITLNGIKKQIALLLFLIPISFSIAGRSGIPYFVKTYELEHARPVLQQLQSYPEKQYPIYVVHNGVPAFKFYTEIYEPPINIAAPNIQFGIWSDNLRQMKNEWKSKGINSIWIFDSHTFGIEKIKLSQSIETIGTTIEYFEDSNTDCYLIELK